MRALFQSFLGYFLTPPGLIVLSALDSSLIFFLPLGIDFVVIVLAAREPDLFWLYALLAALGSLIGAAGTYWIGRKLGEHGLSRLISGSQVRRVHDRVQRTGAVTLALLAIIPPPFPFTGFVLTSGALGVDPSRFFLTLAALRAVRFGTESALAAHYGRGILAWTKSTMFEVVVGALIVLAVAGTVVSAIGVIRGSKKKRR